MTNTSKLKTVTLTKPIQVDGEDVTKITLRKPEPGELRGLKLTDILQMDVVALTTLLPRITQPPLDENQISTDLETEDFMDMAAKTTLFFVKKEQLEGQALELKES